MGRVTRAGEGGAGGRRSTLSLLDDGLLVVAAVVVAFVVLGVVGAIIGTILFLIKLAALAALVFVVARLALSRIR